MNRSAPTFEEAIACLQDYWARQGCFAWLPHNVEVGAGTMNPATFLRVLGPEPWNVAYVEPSIRPDDARYGENPNRVGRHHQLQVIMKPDPGNPQELYLDSLAALGVDPARRDIRFVEDNWESPALGAWGLGWEVWLDGLEITQFTYFQQAGSIDLNPVSVEITYGLDRILMALQGADHFKDLRWSRRITVGDLLLDYEVETSRYYFETADTERLARLFDLFEAEAAAALEAGLVTVAHDYGLKCSHVFNVLDARGAVGVAERARFFRRMRRLAAGAAEAYLADRQAKAFPLLARHPDWVAGASAAEGPGGGPAGDGRSAPREIPSPPAEAADFLFEVGTEELPVAVVDGATATLARAVPELLTDLRLAHGPVTVWGTPRRLAVLVAELAPRQEDAEEMVVGPPARAAFDDSGAPTKAAIGFARSVGTTPDKLEAVERGGEERVAAVRRQAGQPASDALAEALPGLVNGLSFPRSMRWNASGAAFSRPVRWLVALHGDHVVPVRFAGLEAGRLSRGLRPAGSPGLEITAAGEYRPILEGAGVMLATADRRQSVQEQVEALGKGVGGRIATDPALVAEVANLVEQPWAVAGRIEAEFLELPGPVLVTVMKKHQRYFPVQDGDGQLLPWFVAVANGKDLDADALRAGNEAVLRARFADAAYFWRQDTERPLAEYTPKLERLTFEGRLGSVLDKVHRLEALAPELAALLGLSEDEVQTTARAAAIAKSDLATSLVVELTSLQGVVGMEYARRSGEPETVAKAIFEHYLPRGRGDLLPTTGPGVALGLADRLDSLVGLFAVGARPGGAQDPYALRRAAMGVTTVLVAQDTDLDLAAAVDLAAGHLPVAAPPEARQEVLDFLARRLEGQLREGVAPADVVAAVLAARGANPAAAARAVAILGERVVRDDWPAVLTAYARCKRIVRGSSDTRADLDPTLFTEAAEVALHEAVADATRGLDPAAPGAVLDALATLVPAIDRFFDEVLVMADDQRLRANRLALVRRIAEVPDAVADLSRLEGF